MSESGQVRSNAGDSGPMVVDSRKMFVEIGQIRSSVGRNRPNFGRFMVRVADVDLPFDPNLGVFGLNSGAKKHQNHCSSESCVWSIQKMLFVLEGSDPTACFTHALGRHKKERRTKLWCHLKALSCREFSPWTGTKLMKDED